MGRARKDSRGVGAGESRAAAPAQAKAKAAGPGPAPLPPLPRAPPAGETIARTFPAPRPCQGGREGRGGGGAKRPSGRAGRGRRQESRGGEARRAAARGTESAGPIKARRSREARTMLGGAWLAALVLVGSLWAQVAGQPVAAKQCGKECPKFQEKELPLQILKGYEKQMCGAKMVVFFITKKKREFCAKPETNWVQKRIKELDTRAEAAAKSEKLAGDVVPTPAPTGDPFRSPFNPAASTTITLPPAGTGNANPTEGMLTSGGPETAKMTTSELEAKATVATLQPTFLAKGTRASKTTERPMGLGEGLTPTGKVPGLTTAPTVLGSTIFSRSVALPTQPTAHPSDYSSSRVMTSTTSAGVTAPAAASRARSSSNPPSSVQRTSSPGTRPQSTADLTTEVQRRDFSGQSTTESGWDERGAEDQSRAVKDSIVPAGEDSESPLLPEANLSTSTEALALGSTSGFLQESLAERSRARAIANAPEDTRTVFPSELAESRTHVISVGFVASLVGITATLGLYWAYAKSSINGGRTSSKEMVQGLMFTPSYSQAESHSLESF